MRLDVRVTPRASKPSVTIRDGRLHVRVAAPPVDGAANDAVREAVADALDIPRSATRIVVGHHGRKKVIEIAGVDEAAVRRRLTALGAAG